jgi:SAM-dependent methyltransferase
MPWGKTNYQRFIPSLTWQCEPQIERVLSELKSPDARVVDLGAGGRRVSPRAICVDFLPLSSTDLVADVQRLPLRDGSVDLVIATGLFEHVVDERALMEEIHRVLRPGGVAHIEMPFLQQYHDDPIDCRRMTVSGLELAMHRSGFQTQRSGVHIGPSVTIATLLSYYAALLCEGRHVVFKALSTLVFAVVSVILWPLKFLDRFLAGKPSAHRLAFGVYFTGRKA